MPRRLFRSSTPGGRWRWVWRLLWLALAALIAWLALTPAPPRQADLGWDKLNHTAAFATLAVVWMRTGWSSWRLGLLALMAYGGLIEVLQLGVPGRSGEWADWLADGLGTGAGLLLAGLLQRLLPQRA